MEKSLASMKQGESGTITRMEGGEEFKRKLRNIGIRERKVIRVITKQFFDGPVVVEIDGRDTTIGRGMASRVIVEV